MTLSVEIPETLIEQAAVRGIPVIALVSQALEKAGDEPLPKGFVRLGRSDLTPEQAAANIRELRKNVILGDLKIKDLIEEGRRL